MSGQVDLRSAVTQRVVYVSLGQVIYTPKLEFRLGGHVPSGILAGPALGILSLSRVPCWSGEQASVDGKHIQVVVC